MSHELLSDLRKWVNFRKWLDITKISELNGDIPSSQSSFQKFGNSSRNGLFTGKIGLSFISLLSSLWQSSLELDF